MSTMIPNVGPGWGLVGPPLSFVPTTSVDQQQVRAHDHLQDIIATYKLNAGGSHLPMGVRWKMAKEDLENNFFIYRRPSIVYNIIGVVAALLSLASVLPQIIAIIERESACDVSAEFLYGNLVVNFLWLIFSLGNGMYLNGVFAGGVLLMIGFIIYLKQKYDDPENCAA